MQQPSLTQVSKASGGLDGTRSGHARHDSGPIVSVEIGSAATPPAHVEPAWTPREYRAYLKVSERTFHAMEAAGLLATARICGPRLKRYDPEACRAKFFALPTEKAPEPAQLRRARIDRAKRTGDLS